MLQIEENNGSQLKPLYKLIFIMLLEECLEHSKHHANDYHFCLKLFLTP